MGATATVATIVLPWQSVAVGFAIFAFGMVVDPLRPAEQQKQAGLPAEEAVTKQPEANEPPDADMELSAEMEPSAEMVFPFRHYRVRECRRIIATLQADSSLLVVGKEGSGKSVLVEAVVKELLQSGFVVINLEQATPKNMLKQMAEELEVPVQTLEGKSLSADELKDAIEMHLGQRQDNKAFLVIDNAHRCDIRFRDWLKILKRRGVPMFLAATEPPRTDIFLNIPRIELAPLPDYAIREIMEQAALERGLSLKPHELATLQERAGGNPMLAKRAIEEEYLGVDTEAGDHGRYFDLTPLILLVGVGLMVTRFVALGTHNSALYILAGSSGALFMGASYVMRSLPKEDRRIRV